MKTQHKILLIYIVVAFYILFSFPVFALSQENRLSSCFYDSPGIALLISGKIIALSLVHIFLSARWSGRFVIAIAMLIMAGVSILLFFGELDTQQWEKTVANPIRIDLLVVPPFLALLEFAGLAAWITGWFMPFEVKNKHNNPNKALQQLPRDPGGSLGG